ncbi:MAG: hypothetical protein QOF21_2922 [Actinomycetota bacterium]|jgi:rhodanese-related sulfurtransferase
MITEVNRHDVTRLVAEGAQLLDVLPPDEFEDSHLPGAINIPLPHLAERARALLDPNRPTVVYCYDSVCDLSPRGARRLVSLGFADVYDYVASKIDWIGAGLPFEGSRVEAPHLSSLADRFVPRCKLDETTADVRERIGDAPICVVVDDDHVVLGVVDREALLGPDKAARDVMHEGPRTFRPHVSALEAAKIVDESPQPWILVSNLDGILVGLTDAEHVREAAFDSTTSS